ncbi:MAG TPA: hypothetical protein VHY33_00925 [Thermoanaerobaculia bacterium]|nr:hypothetical protein [Thermoanaerobaculia bacterium]
MKRSTRLLAAAMLIALVAAGCGKEKKSESTEPESFAFTIYPGSRYLAQLTDLWKQARKVFRPNDDVPPIAIYDTDAPLDKVAEFYAQSYGYNKIAPDATNNLSSAKPPAYYYTGDLAKDAAAIVPVAQKLNIKLDASKAVGAYRGAQIDPKPNRPRVTITRPYFDASTSQTVDRTLIMMAQ